MGYAVHIELVFGTAKKAIPKIINAPDQNFDILILGSHGHQFMKDIILGTTVDSVRHKVSIPVFIV